MPDIIATIERMIRQGASTKEIIDTLASMGIPEEDARKLILLAERDMLRVLRNEIREIAGDEFTIRIEQAKKDILRELSGQVDKKLTLAQKTLHDFLRKSLDSYVSEVSRLEDRVSLLERKVYDLESRVARLESSQMHVKGSSIRWIRILLPALGLASMGASLYFSASKLLATIFFALGIVLIIGGIALG